MQKWSQSITEQWKNLQKVMEKEREWKHKIKGMDWSFRGGARVHDGGKVGGTRAWLGRALWSEEGAHMLKVTNGSGGEVRGWRCTWLDWREERAWLGGGHLE